MSKTSIKLFIDMKKNKVVFAEAGKQFVDFLFNLFALPVGSVVSLLAQEEGMVGSLGNLFESVQTLSSAYMQPNADKDFILKPVKNSSDDPACQPLLLAKDLMSEPEIFVCGKYSLMSQMCAGGYVSSDPSLKCQSCGYLMSRRGICLGKKDTRADGFVRSLAIYMVMDDLTVKPMSTISDITTMLEKFNIKDISLLQEKVVDVARADGLKLLKESLSSQTVLTNVFLRKSTPRVQLTDVKLL